MSDGYRQGHDRGKADAEAGKDRDMRPPVVQAVLKGTNYTSTYTEGYKKGFEEGKKG
jgi:hypothetical protein